MKFGKKLRSLMVAEWREFYLNYKFLKGLLSPYKLMNKYHILEEVKSESLKIMNFSTELAELSRFNENFDKLLFGELKKVSIFYHHRLDQLISKWRRLKINAILVKISKARVDYEDKKIMLKNAFEIYYKEIRLLSQFIRDNLEGFQKILKKHRKLTHNFLNSDDLKNKYEEELRNRRLTSHKDYVQNLVVHIEQDYLEIFYKPNQRKLGQYELKKIYQGKLISQNESFLFGFFIGLAIACIFLAFVLIWAGSMSVEDDPEFKGVFPLFRGMGLIIVYYWLLTICVYGWTECNINYRLIFGFNHHYSTVPEILSRVSFFTAVYIGMILWFIVIRQEIGDINTYIDFIPMEMTPLIVWMIFLGYLFFPSKENFNYPGRYYFLYLFKETIESLIYNSRFRARWAADQILSFVITMKDIIYMFCYYFSKDSDTENCHEFNQYPIILIIAGVPVFIRVVQSLRQVWEQEKFKMIYIGNSIKYIMLFLAITVGYFAVLHENRVNIPMDSNIKTLLGLWFILATTVVIYTIFWDIKYDWGFLGSFNKNKYLREELAINNPTFYYIGVVLSIFLRISWIFSICPNILLYYDFSESTIFYIGIFEILRRSIWNFFRIEREHIYNCGDFRATDNFKLPYEDIEFEFDENQAFFSELYSVLHSGNLAEENFDKKSSKKISLGKISSSQKHELRKTVLIKGKDSEWLKNLDLEACLDSEIDFDEVQKSIKEFKKKIDEKMNHFAVNPMDDKKK